jgi:hypothetical protein
MMDRPTADGRAHTPAASAEQIFGDQVVEVDELIKR